MLHGGMNITISDVPEEVHDVLAARAQRSGRSLEDYLRQSLVEMATSVDQDEPWDRIEERVKRTGVTLTADEILESIHDGRR